MKINKNYYVERQATFQFILLAIYSIVFFVFFESSHVFGYMVAIMLFLLLCSYFAGIYLIHNYFDQMYKKNVSLFIEASVNFTTACKSVNGRDRNSSLKIKDWKYQKDIWYESGKGECPLFIHKLGFCALVVDGIPVIFSDKQSLKSGLNSYNIYDHNDYLKIINRYVDKSNNNSN